MVLFLFRGKWGEAVTRIGSSEYCAMRSRFAAASNRTQVCAFFAETRSQVS